MVRDKRPLTTRTTNITNEMVKRTVLYLKSRVDYDEKQCGESWDFDTKVEKMQELSVEALEHLSAMVDSLNEEL